jgi:predicted nucleic acid-binding protein
MGVTVLDAGVIIAVLDQADAHHGSARAALAAAQTRIDSLVVPASVYAEALVGPFRAGAGLEQVVDQFLDALPATVEPASREIAREAARLRAEYGNRLRLPDAHVIATARVLGADTIVTTDSDWPEVGITVDLVKTAVPREQP